MTFPIRVLAAVIGLLIASAIVYSLQPSFTSDECIALIEPGNPMPEGC